MAINTWINVIVDPAANSKADRADDVHQVARGTAAANDLSLSFDSAKVVNMTTLRSMVDAAIKSAAGGAELTV